MSSRAYSILYCKLINMIFITFASLLYRSLYDVVINTSIPTMLEDLSLQMTMFAPIDFRQMRRTKLGISLLDDSLYASRVTNVHLQFTQLWHLLF